jgi:hypothetical protein
MIDRQFNAETWRLWKRWAFLWQVPTQVAITTALAQGGALTPGGLLPSNPVAFDLPATRSGLVLPASGTLTITLPAIAAGRVGSITALGLDTGDQLNTRVTTRVNAIAVPPEVLTIGSIGTSLAPVPLGAPIRLSAGDVFSLFLENLSAADIQVQPRIIGTN